MSFPRLTVLPVGQGSGNLIEVYDKDPDADSDAKLVYLALVDCGYIPFDEYWIGDDNKKILLGYMKEKMETRRRSMDIPKGTAIHDKYYLDMFLLTHQDLDHYNLMSLLVQNIVKETAGTENLVCYEKDNNKYLFDKGYMLIAKQSVDNDKVECNYYKRVKGQKNEKTFLFNLTYCEIFEKSIGKFLFNKVKGAIVLAGSDGTTEIPLDEYIGKLDFKEQNLEKNLNIVLCVYRLLNENVTLSKFVSDLNIREWLKKNKSTVIDYFPLDYKAFVRKFIDVISKDIVYSNMFEYIKRQCCQEIYDFSQRNPSYSPNKFYPVTTAYIISFIKFLINIYSRNFNEEISNKTAVNIVDSFSNAYLSYYNEKFYAELIDQGIESTELTDIKKKHEMLESTNGVSHLPFFIENSCFGGINYGPMAESFKSLLDVCTNNKVCSLTNCSNKIVFPYGSIDVLCTLDSYSIPTSGLQTDGTVSIISNRAHTSPSAQHNASSAVTLWTFPGSDCKLLMTGDATVHTMFYFNQLNSVKLEECAGSILTAPHHGSDKSSQGRKESNEMESHSILKCFLETTKPKYIVLSTGVHSPFSHPGVNFVNASDAELGKRTDGNSDEEIWWFDPEKNKTFGKKSKNLVACFNVEEVTGKYQFTPVYTRFFGASEMKREPITGAVKLEVESGRGKKRKNSSNKQSPAKRRKKMNKTKPKGLKNKEETK